MKVFAITEKHTMGDVKHLQEIEVDKPKPEGHSILVRIKAIATNPIDYKWLASTSDTTEKLDTPLIVGWDASGIVEEVGSDASLFKPGDEVFFAGDITKPGAYGEYTVIDERIVGKKPSTVSWSKAAALPLTSLTAWEAMIDKLHIPIDPSQNEGKTILITAAAGGVGSIATQIAKKVLGLTVIATASRPETAQFVKQNGADFVVNHHEKYQPQLDTIGITTGLDYIMHCTDVSEELFNEFTEIIKPFGSIASISTSSVRVDLQKLFWKAITYCGELMFTRPMEGVDLLRQHEILDEVSRLVDEGVLSSTEQRSFPLTASTLQEALIIQHSGKAIGKTTLFFEK